MCTQLIRECPAKISNVDIQIAAVFVATYSTEDEIKRAGLAKIIPARRYKTGNKPTPGHR